MSFENIFFIVPSPFLSGLIWFLIGSAFLYAARDPFHRLILNVSQLFRNSCRVASFGLLRAEHALRARNKEVLLAQGREASERIIEREFERVENAVRNDMSQYPAQHRRVEETIAGIEKSYQDSVEIPPEPPAWIKAIDAIAKLPSKADPGVSEILEDIHDSLVKASHKSVEAYRVASNKRHHILKNIMPEWRKLGRTLNGVNKNVAELNDRAKLIDRHMDEYENIIRRSNHAVRMLSSSALTQFFIAGLVLAIAIGGALINFNLIARPMQEMVGGASLIMGFKTANIAALVIILVEIAMGLFLMETLRITRLFPVISALNDKTRVRMMWVTFGILLALASVEAGLAYMREILAQDEVTLKSALLADQAVTLAGTQNRLITTAAQMGMGFILPFALVFVAIPLESFINSVRTVVGIFGVALLRVLRTTVRALGVSIHFFGQSLTHLYDVCIFGPLWVETRFFNRTPTNAKHHTDKPDKPQDFGYSGK